jgi:cyanophycinase-like exopeptidase
MDKNIMSKSNLFLIAVYSFILVACSKKTAPTASVPLTKESIHSGIIVTSRPASLGITGDSADVSKKVDGGVVLIGGGTDVKSAFKWMIERSGGGDVVIIRASGTNAYNPFIYELGTVNSVETLKIDSRDLANNDTVATIIRNAEMLFIAGGDQSNYMKYWKGTKTQDAVNYLLNEKKAPVGGTSAGCAILSGFYYSGEKGSTTSSQALKNPYDSTVTLYNNDFLKAPYLSNVISDQHYLTRNREGRSIVFLGRILKEWNTAAQAIAVDERTAVCIDSEGKAKVYGDEVATRPYSYAYFIKTDPHNPPEQLEANKTMVWNKNNRAMEVYEIQASLNGGGYFNVKTFNLSEAKGGKLYWWWADNGVVSKKEQ